MQVSRRSFLTLFAKGAVVVTGAAAFPKIAAGAVLGAVPKITAKEIITIGGGGGGGSNLNSVGFNVKPGNVIGGSPDSYRLIAWNTFLNRK